jgi:hypothetical protein
MVSRDTRRDGGAGSVAEQGTRRDTDAKASRTPRQETPRTVRSDPTNYRVPTGSTLRGFVLMASGELFRHLKCAHASGR